MSFDVNKFDTTSFVMREHVVKVPELKNFFGKKDKPDWVVRALTATELALSNDAVSSNKNIEGVISYIKSQLQKDKVEAVK